MSNWRNMIFELITREDSPLLIICDPDGLIQEEEMLSSLKEQGHDVIVYGDPVAFRYIYESKYRNKWDRGEVIPSHILLLNRNRDHKVIPYDVLERGNVISIGIPQIFPKLSYPIVEKIEKKYFEDLYAAYEEYEGEPLGDRDSTKFILESVYGIVVHLIRTDEDLFKMLFRIHYKKMEIPKVMMDYLENALRTVPDLKKRDLVSLFDREKFFQYVQRKWHDFVVAPTSDQEIEIPFDEKEIRGYIEDLFLEGVLSPVTTPMHDNLPFWANVGITVDPLKDTESRLIKVLAKIGGKLQEASGYGDWQEISELWAEGLYFRYKLGWEIPKYLVYFDEIHRKIESSFKEWLLKNFGTLYNLPYRPSPVMVHHIPHYIASETDGKIALIVIDGLALDQWRVLKDELAGLLLDEFVVYSWVPTLTFVSRRALFGGDPPYYFADMSSDTKDELYWVRFWENRNFPADKVYYQRGLKLIDFEEVEKIIQDPQKTILGLVVNMVDEFLHSAQMGTLEIHRNVKTWAREGYLNRLIDELLARGFEVYIASDHGNVYAKGIGIPREGVLAEKKGSRARIYNDPDFLMRTAQRFQSIVWPGEYFVPGYSVLLADELSAFIRDGEFLVTHGGISLEEVLVPFVRIRKGDQSEKSRI